jgi:hypothetical protein
MQASGSIPETPKVDLHDLSGVLEADGPFLTVYLTTEGAIENAAQRSQQRWKALRNQLEAAGAAVEALDAVEPLVDEAHQAGAMLAAVVTREGVQLVEHLQEPTTDDRGTWSRLPDLVPLLRWRQSQVPYVLALADRGGADLTTTSSARRGPAVDRCRSAAIADQRWPPAQRSRSRRPASSTL